MSRKHSIPGLVLLVSSTSFSCSETSSKNAASDAATTIEDARGTSDASRAEDASPPLGWVDFSIGGCASGDGSEVSPCFGQSPLSLRFTALAPATLETHVWDFGDGSDLDSRRSPEHRFTEPGSYDISLNVDGPGGSAGRRRLAAVVVIPAALGAACEGDSQCASNDCVCGTGDVCPAPLDNGMCALGCESHEACGGNACIDLRAPEGTEPWRRATCLPSCDPSETISCATGSCQALRGIDGGLRYACFVAGLLAPVGSSCAGPTGILDSARCASGQCADLGLRGVCTSACSDAECPLDSACVTPTSGVPASLCLSTCETSLCDDDPELSCRIPGDGFTVAEPALEDGYCTPLFE